MLVLDDDVFDLECDMLEEFLSLVDRKLKEMSSLGPLQHLVDSGVADSMEHIHGIAFVACQRYITSACRWAETPKPQALQMGDCHSCGHTYASLIHAAANYWKHQDESSSLAVSPVIHPGTRQPLEALGIEMPSSFPMSCVLAELGAQTFRDLIGRLTDWRDVVLRVRQHTEPTKPVEPTGDSSSP